MDEDASPAIGVGSLMARDVTSATGVDGPITKNTTLTISSGGLVIEPLALATLVAEPSVLVICLKILLVNKTPENILRSKTFYFKTNATKGKKKR